MSARAHTGLGVRGVLEIRNSRIYRNACILTRIYCAHTGLGVRGDGDDKNSSSSSGGSSSNSDGRINSSSSSK